MSADLYTTDILSWSERQAGLLRRLSRGERVNVEIDWQNVIEEVQDVGQSELRSVRSLLARALEHLLKIHGWPSGPREHWRSEALTFLVDARRSLTPSMRGRIDLSDLYQEARAVVQATTVNGTLPQALSREWPFSLDDLIVDRPHIPDIGALLEKVAGPS